MTDRRLLRLVPRPLRELPADLVAVVALTLLADVVMFAPLLRSSPVRFVLGFLLATLLPGYAVISALFPAGDDSSITDGTLTGVERLLLGVAMTLVAVPGTLFLIDLSPFDIRLFTVAAVLNVLTFAFVAVAVLRRRRLPPEERFAVPYRAWLGAWRDALTTDDRSERVANIALTVLLVAAAASVTYAVAAPSPGEPFTEFYVLADDPGEPGATEYPKNLTRDQPTELLFLVENHEGTRRSYTVSVELHRVENDTVVERTQLERYRTTLAPNATWQRRHEVTPTTTGDRLRLTYLLYVGGAPSDASVEAADQRLHIWVDVSPP